MKGMKFMNKSFRKRMASLAICCTLVLGSVHISFADGARVVTLGANLSAEQKATMLKYFGVNENEVVLLEVNNQEERKYLEGVASEAQIGTKTFSCAYVEPTKAGSGINVKTANLTWLTSSMVASTLATAGLTDADCVVASVFPVSGTGALTGIMKAFEDATGKPLDEDKKELASEELIITGDIGEDIGQDKAAGIVNDIKTEIIKNNTSDTVQIADTINNITNNYNVTLNVDQQKQLEELMSKISKQDYNYSQMKDTLSGIKDTIDDKLDELGESVNKGFFDTIKDWFSDIGDWFTGLFNKDDEDLGILGSTNDSILGNNAVIDATDENAINLPSSEEVEGFFAKIWNWFTGLFDSNDSNNIEDNSNATPNEETTNDDAVNSLEENSTIDENVQPNSSVTSDNQMETNVDNTINSDNVNNLNSENQSNTLDSETTITEQ